MQSHHFAFIDVKSELPLLSPIHLLIKIWLEHQGTRNEKSQYNMKNSSTGDIYILKETTEEKDLAR